MGKRQTTPEGAGSTRYRFESIGCVGEWLSLSTLSVSLWATVITASILDVLTTTVGLRRGLSEGNVLAGALVETLGVGGFVGLKLAAVAVLVTTWYLVDEQQRYAALAGFGGVTVVVVVCNVATIATS
ncbi:DUF5658 family protein [Halorhabdus sp. BNX81]|uniref:DUF5658 family protein n=1 Tax=Halorhabdus sp. BNX81 TaxID=2980181 RepID=UPI0023DD44E1|nr:DUF5658 family protein [Halorhabdus sp. BNX81]WEL22661.1 putative membrane protein [Halorhabdus sp. BNX81]